jgi:transposase-like protein
MKYTFKQFQAEYPTDAACLDKIMEIQYGGLQITCPGCGADSRFSRIAKRRAYACQFCGHHIYPCVGTPFEKSRTPLTNWFFAMYLRTTTRHGVAAKELERQIGCTYKTAWRMAHELRKLMASADDHGPLSGHVEMDETYVGGKKRGKGRGIGGGYAARGKTTVFGMLERGGSLRAAPIAAPTQREIVPVVYSNVQRGSTISTDEGTVYAPLAVGGPYNHGVVNHRLKEYVRGIHHVNGIEGFWGHFKSGIRGTNIHISAKHMWKYLSECTYRYNTRGQGSREMFNRLVDAFALPRLVEP